MTLTPHEISLDWLIPARILRETPEGDTEHIDRRDAPEDAARHIAAALSQIRRMSQCDGYEERHRATARVGGGVRYHLLVRWWGQSDDVQVLQQAGVPVRVTSSNPDPLAQRQAIGVDPGEFAPMPQADGLHYEDAVRDVAERIAFPDPLPERKRRPAHVMGW